MPVCQTRRRVGEFSKESTHTEQNQLGRHIATYSTPNTLIRGGIRCVYVLFLLFLIGVLIAHFFTILSSTTTLAQSAVRTVLELVMREELDAFIGAAWGECNLKRKGYRNGTYTRDLVTATGRLEDLKVPRDREGHFHTQAFERYQRYEPLF